MTVLDAESVDSGDVPDDDELDGADDLDAAASDDAGSDATGSGDRGPWSLSWRTVGWIVAGLVVAGLFARLASLGDRPLHHDESLDAWFSWRYLNGDYDGYDPVYHGPLRFYITAWFFLLFGESESTARLIAALAGAGVVALPWFWRRELGRAGTIGAVGLLAFTPSMLYFSRFGREDSFFLLLTVASVIVLLRFLSDPRPWHPMAFLCLTVAAMAVKESVFLGIFVLGALAMVLITQEAFVARPGPARGDDVDDDDLDLDPGPDPALEAVDAGDSDGRRLDEHAVRRLVIVAALVGMTLAFMAGEPIFLSLGVYGLVLGAAMVFAVRGAVRRGVAFRELPVVRSFFVVPAGWWAATVGATVFLFAALFTQFFTNFDGPGSEAAPHGALRNGLFAGFEYWLGEHDTVRGDSRWQYYLAVIPGYEFVVVALAVVGIVRVMRRPTLVGESLLFWGAGSLIVHSWAGERMPWLIIHPLFPFVVLAGLGVQVLVENRHRVVVWPAAAALVAGLLFTGWTSYQAAYVRGGEPQELFVQAGQATPDVTAWTERLQLLDRLVFSEQGRHLVASIDADVYWPYGWYLRDFPTPTYAIIDVTQPAPEADVIFVPHWKRELGTGLVGNGYTELPYEHRWWWVPDFDVSPGDWLSWVWDRTVWDGSESDPSDLPGILVGSVYIRDDVLALEQQYLAG